MIHKDGTSPVGSNTMGGDINKKSKIRVEIGVEPIIQNSRR